ncbi:Transposase [Thermoplasmatales archaeon]|nr:Transposase [Thermoplasmatales archaeon]
MTERRRWKAEEKLALISEIREKDQVVETSRKYGVDPSMFYT